MEASDFIKDAITNNKVVLFMKGTAQFPQCGFSGQVIQILKKIGLKDIATINVLEDDQVRQEIKNLSAGQISLLRCTKLENCWSYSKRRPFFLQNEVFLKIPLEN